MDVWRPCDTVETAVAWQHALERRNGPTCLILSRQNSAFQKRNPKSIEAIGWGGYVVADCECDGSPQAVILATGTEVEVAMAARALLAGQGIGVRVVSMPCTQLFDRQDAIYQHSVLPRGVPRVAIEAGVSDFWWKYVGAFDGAKGRVIGIDRFGESAPAKELFGYFGLTAAKVVDAVKSVL